MCIFIYCFSNRKRKRGFSIVKEPSFILWKFKLLSGLCKLYKFGWVFPINIQLHCFHLSCQRGSNSCTFKHFKISLAGAVTTTPPSCQAKTKSQQNKAKWSKILPADLTKLFVEFAPLLSAALYNCQCFIKSVISSIISMITVQWSPNP